MRITIVTVTYNCSATIEKTINSVLKQKDIDSEYIIIDGKSTDGTIEIISRYKDNLSKFISEPDCGIYDAMNKAISLAKGDYLIFLNGDDSFCDEYTLARISNYFEENEIVIGQVYYGSRISEKPSKSIESPYYGVFYPHQGMFISRDLFEKYGAYDTSYRISADFEWICRMIFNGVKVKWVEVPVSYYKIGGRSESVQRVIDEHNISYKYLLMSKHEELLPNLLAHTAEDFKNMILCEVLKSPKYDLVLKQVVNSIFGRNCKVNLWGNGYLSGLFINALDRCGITIGRIIEKNPARSHINGIPVCLYKKEYIDNLIVTTEAYDREISDYLVNEGFCDGKDFLSHHLMKNTIAKYLRDDEVFLTIYKGCGLSLNDFLI